jgi:membrane-bound lytic murein transglycosylase A
MNASSKTLFFSILFLSLTGCTTIGNKVEETPPPQFIPVVYASIGGWEADAQQDSLRAFQKTCARFLKLPPDKDTGLKSKAIDWQIPCQNLPQMNSVNPAEARTYFETYFKPYQIRSADTDTGLFTGYYEASLRGSPIQTGVYQTPLRVRPSDLVMVNLGEFIPDLKGQRIAGRVKEGQLKPYEDRAKIETGHLPTEMDKALYWVDSAVDAFFLQVQGSGVVTLPDGNTVRVGYDGQNGHPYTAIGKELIARGELTKETVSMQSIRDWLTANPSEASDVMRLNKSYVFFRKLDTEGPVGAEGVVLTPERSLAIDSSIWPYGLPMFINAEHPIDKDPIRKLLVAQDTGGAIRGNIRGDFFWGYGDKAAAYAGPMKSKGYLWILLPKTVQPQAE